jgi:hypothetical protein
MALLHVAMSLDGFIAGPGHDMSWRGGAEYDTSSELADEIARSTGVVLAGRGWHEVASTGSAPGSRRHPTPGTSMNDPKDEANG